MTRSREGKSRLQSDDAQLCKGMQDSTITLESTDVDRSSARVREVGQEGEVGKGRKRTLQVTLHGHVRC